LMMVKMLMMMQKSHVHKPGLNFGHT